MAKHQDGRQVIQGFTLSQLPQARMFFGSAAPTNLSHPHLTGRTGPFITTHRVPVRCCLVSISSLQNLDTLTEQRGQSSSPMMEVKRGRCGTWETTPFSARLVC